MSLDLAILENDVVTRQIRANDELELTFINGFEKLPKLTEIGPDKKAILKKWCQNLVEKCPLHSKENCSKCIYSENLDNGKNCLLRLFSYFTNQVPQSHHGHEYYDFEVKIVTNIGKLIPGAIFLKKIEENKYLTNSSDKNLKTQIIDVLIDDTIEIVGVLAKPNYKLKSVIRNLCKQYSKKLFFIEEEAVITMLCKRAENEADYNLGLIKQILDSKE